ncbi:MAG: PEP-CTERM sorting domain-containing protein [Rubrivivax sp.]|nr:PEP-CTERM sorting domain-containing protein [Rubrivivax sp.]
MKLHALALAATTALAMGAAHADTYTLSGSITLSDAVFNRPFTLTSLSGLGTAVHYDAFNFVGVTPGAYSFTMVSGPAPATFDTFLALYAGGFNPAAPLTNLVALNDDLASSLTSSGFNFTLMEGMAYTLVSTAYSNSGVGDYTTTVATVVPEPGTYGLMGLGLLGMCGWMRRRQQPQA